MTAQYVYQPLFADIRAWLQQGLNDLGMPLDQAISYAIVECNFLQADAAWKALDFTALSTVAFETEITDHKQLALLAQYVRQYCSDEIVAVAAAGMKTDSDRQAFLRDIQHARNALRI